MQKLRADAVADAKVVARVRKEQERLTARQAKIVAENKRVLADNERANQLIERLWDALDRPPPVPQPVPQPEQAQQPHTEPVRLLHPHVAQQSGLLMQTCCM